MSNITKNGNLEKNITEMDLSLSNTLYTKLISNRSSNDALKKLTILIVDDECMIRDSMKRVITKQFSELNGDLELRLIDACDGLECLVAIYLATQQNIRINAIISDETMPFLTGSYSSKIIKDVISKGYTNKIPMYICTALSHTNIRENYSDIVRKIYSKPIDKNCIKEIFSDLELV